MEEHSFLCLNMKVPTPLSFKLVTALNQKNSAVLTFMGNLSSCHDFVRIQSDSFQLKSAPVGDEIQILGAALRKVLFS